jgi:hypothetical protein
MIKLRTLEERTDILDLLTPDLTNQTGHHSSQGKIVVQIKI